MNERPEATPPPNLPTGELSLVPDKGRDLQAEYRAGDILNGDAVTVESAYKASIQSGTDYNERMQASIAKAQNASPESVVTPLPPVMEDDPIGDAIAEELKRVEELTRPLEASPQPSIHDRMQDSWHAMQVAKGIRVEVPESERRASLYSTATTETQKKPAGDFVARNTFKADYDRRMSLNPVTRVGNAVSSVAGKVGDKLAEWGGQIEAGEEERARKALEKSESKNKNLGDRAKERRAVAVALWEASQRKIAAEKVRSAPRNTPAISSSKAQNVTHIDEARARLRNSEAGDTRSTTSRPESESKSSAVLETNEDQESIALLAREIQLQEEDLKIQEDELHLRRRKLLLLQRQKAFEELKKRGGKSTPPSGGGGLARAIS